MRVLLASCVSVVAVLAGGAAASKSYYDLLGVPERADAQQIKRAFRKVSLKYHPDKCKEADCQEKFMQVNKGAGGRPMAAARAPAQPPPRQRGTTPAPGSRSTARADASVRGAERRRQAP